MNSTAHFSGSVFEFYENGTEKLNGRYRNGLKNGKWTWWNRDSGIDSTGSYKNGIRHGQWKFYFSDGNLYRKGQYRDGNGIDRGFSRLYERYGKWTQWHENGQKDQEGKFKDGIVDGKWTQWHENGQKSFEGKYKDGTLNGLITQWHENGQKKEEGEYLNGERIKGWVYYTEDGLIIKNVCISTDFGIMILELYPEVAPKHVESFIQHVKNGYYNGTTFHRVIPGFVIQGGDPNSKDNNRDDDGQGGHAARYFGHGDENVAASWTLPAEFNERPHITGALSMARAQENNSAGSQFFICAAPVHQLDNKYTVFGQVISGLEVIQKIVNVPRDRSDNPSDKIEMEIDFCEK